jgi:hypothetical protein
LATADGGEGLGERIPRTSSRIVSRNHPDGRRSFPLPSEGSGSGRGVRFLLRFMGRRPCLSVQVFAKLIDIGALHCEKRGEDDLSRISASVAPLRFYRPPELGCGSGASPLSSSGGEGLGERRPCLSVYVFAKLTDIGALHCEKRGEDDLSRISASVAPLRFYRPPELGCSSAALCQFVVCPPATEALPEFSNFAWNTLSVRYKFLR